MKLPLWVLALLLMTACGTTTAAQPNTPAVDISSETSDASGLARVDSAAGVLDLRVFSGLTGEALGGARISVATFGETRLLLATDPVGQHLPVAVPLAGEATVRRLVLPPTTAQGYNISTASSPLNLGDLTALGRLDEAEIRDLLAKNGNEAVLLYLYNPVAPLALTGTALEAFATPFNNVYVLRAGGEPPDAMLGLTIVCLDEPAYQDWEHLKVDRYLAGRVGKPPDTDLHGDLSFAWAYPVYEVYPPDKTLELGTGDQVILRVNWRSANPDPPAPWIFFVSTEADWLTIEPETFGLEPAQSQEVTLTVDRTGLEMGDHSATIYIRPFSDLFGAIEQDTQRTLTINVAEAEPTPTPGPSIGLYYTPEDPHEGDTLVVSAGGFVGGEAVLVEFAGPERTISDALPAAESDGTFQYTIDLDTVPADTYTLTLTGQQSGITGSTTVVVGEGQPDAIVTSDELNLRTGPGYEYPVLEILVRGDELTVISTNWDDTWLEVEMSTGVRGWVLTNLLELNIDLAEVPWNPNFPAPR